MNKTNSVLARKRQEKEQEEAAHDQFIKQQLNDVWFNAREGVHLVRKGEVIVPDKGYLKALEYPLSRLIRTKKEIRQCINELDAQIKHERSVQYHGPVAGQKTGTWLECSGSRWLVTSSPKYIEPVKGGWPNLRKLIETLLPEPIAQAALYSWCKTQYLALQRGRHSPCPILIFAGDADDGKTLLLSLLTDLRGGRFTNPIGAWSGEGPAWTDHLLGCECLNIDDSVPLKNYQSRQNLATKVKEVIFAGSVTIDKRNNTSFTIEPRPLWSVVMAVNANSDSIKTVPALDGADMADKAVVLRTHRADILYREQGDSAAEARYKAYADELAAFAYWLAKEFRLPAELPKGCFLGRSGALVYRDPLAMTDLHRASPAGTFEEVILQIGRAEYSPTNFETNDKEGFRGEFSTAFVLSHCRTFYERDRRIPESAITAGIYLGQIANRPDSCIEDAGKDRNGSKIWRFRPGAFEGEP